MQVQRLVDAVLAQGDADGKSLDERDKVGNVGQEEGNGAYDKSLLEEEEAREGTEDDSIDGKGRLCNEYRPLVLVPGTRCRLFVEEHGHSASKGIHGDSLVIQDETHGDNGEGLVA